MKVNRRQAFRWSAAVGFCYGPLASWAVAGRDDIPLYERPLFSLRNTSKVPIKITSIELLQRDSAYFLRTTSADGVSGLIQTKQVEDFIPILLRRVAPFFIGKDGRDLESLIDEVYIENYKMAGQAFWCPVAYVEQSLLDLLGKTAGKPVGELLGGVIRKEIPVYLSGSSRELKAEQEVAIYEKGIQFTGARAVKFKIGGRMSRNEDAYPGRTETMIALARKKLGDRITIYADANGSYSSSKAIEVGRMLEDLHVAFFEEPCPWEELEETKKVADALRIPVAFGEQDSSLWLFQWTIDNRVMDIVQPDLNYNGGLIRGARVARMAKEANMPITPHNTQTDAGACNILQFASAIPNIGPYIEFPWRRPQKQPGWYSPVPVIQNGVIKVPTGPGMGIEIDPDYLKRAKKVEL